MTHTKKLTIFFLAFTTLFTFLLLEAFGTQTAFGNRFRDFFDDQAFKVDLDTDSFSDQLSAKLLRFRVLADSDSSQDQADKRTLCSKLIPLLSDQLSTVQTKEEAVTLVRESLPFLTAYCNDVLSFSGKSVSCSLGPHLFPYKSYGNYQFPAGIYDTLLVTIGSGSGSNWWCLAFPPLCFADEAFVDVPDDSSQLLMELFDSDTYHAILLNSDELATDSSKSQTSEHETIQKPRFTLQLFSLLEQIFG